MGPQHTASSKKGAAKLGAVLVHADEASFRQDSTIFRTWSRQGHRPTILTTGCRNTQHIYGAIALETCHFTYHFASVFNGSTFLVFLRQVLTVFAPRPVFLILDNARYHKHPEVQAWCHHHRERLRLWFLPPYWPELNATERLWGHVRQQSTHNRFFATTTQLVAALRNAFRTIQRHPDTIDAYLQPYR